MRLCFLLQKAVCLFLSTLLSAIKKLRGTESNKTVEQTTATHRENYTQRNYKVSKRKIRDATYIIECRENKEKENREVNREARLNKESRYNIKRLQYATVYSGI